jgi:DNA-directed RNA polymerase specialized sigma24 family protein
LNKGDVGVSSDEELIRQALAGDRPAIDRLVDRLTPIVQARIARLLLARARATGRDMRAQVEDMSQEVFLSLFDHDGRVLRAWDRQRGLSLENFVGFVAHRQAISILRNGATCPFTEEATEQRALLELVDETAPAQLEQDIAARETLLLLLDQLRLSLSPRSLEMFERLFVLEESVESLRATTGLSAAAVHTWRSRLGKLARAAGKTLFGQEETWSAVAAAPRRSRGMP